MHYVALITIHAVANCRTANGACVHILKIYLTTTAPCDCCKYIPCL